MSAPSSGSNLEIKKHIVDVFNEHEINDVTVIKSIHYFPSKVHFFYYDGDNPQARRRRNHNMVE